MNFIYALSYKRKIFYIGRSKNPYSRISKHIIRCCIYVNGKPKFGVQPKIKILNHCLLNDLARKVEMEEIYKYLLIGMPLLNIHGTGQLFSKEKYPGKIISLGRDTENAHLPVNLKKLNKAIEKYIKKKQLQDYV